MDDKEAVELNAWIAEHVMEYHRGHPGGSKVEYWQPPPYKWGVIPVENLPKFTADRAAAMQVLEKCISNLGWSRIVSFGQTSDGNYFMNHSDSDPSSESFCNVESETIPLAICLFAKKLFSK